MIRLVKLALLGLCLGWGAYSIYGLWEISQILVWLDRLNGTVAMAHSTDTGLSSLLAALQAVAVTVGPAIAVAIFLFVRWPAKRSTQISN